MVLVMSFTVRVLDMNEKLTRRIAQLKEQRALVEAKGYVSDELLKKCRQRMRDYAILSGVLEDVANVPYSPIGANCYDHSKQLVNKLYLEGFQSSIMVNSDRTHAWVAVWIDANTGRLIRVGQGNQKLLELRDRSLKVICD
jgi:hypothetical protein